VAGKLLLMEERKKKEMNPPFTSAAPEVKTVKAHSSSSQHEAKTATPGYTSVNGSMATLLLSGQGAQQSGMMKELYKCNSIIRDTLDRGEGIFRAARGYSILDIMFRESSAINSTENTQPAVFLSSAALYNVLSADGFNPRYFIGHSLVECTALYCSGILGFDETVKLVLKRSSLMKETSENIPGEIMAVFKDWKAIAELIEKNGLKDVYIANKNSDRQTVVSGKPGSISEFTGHLKSRGIIYRKLPLSGAFHTPLFSSASEGLRAHLAGVRFRDRKSVV
jgi:acyl transferase domain-containing protein